MKTGWNGPPRGWWGAIIRNIFPIYITKDGFTYVTTDNFIYVMKEGTP